MNDADEILRGPLHPLFEGEENEIIEHRSEDGPIESNSSSSSTELMRNIYDFIANSSTKMHNRTLIDVIWEDQESQDEINSRIKSLMEKATNLGNSGNKHLRALETLSFARIETKKKWTNK